MKRTAEIEGFSRTPILFSHNRIYFQPSASRTDSTARLNPSDKSLGYFHVVRSTDDGQPTFWPKPANGKTAKSGTTFLPSSVFLLPYSSWRRGWDSNPRNGFPFTAFPVLPIQPLLHLSCIANFRLPIADWFRGAHTSFANKDQSEIGIWQSAMSWRRGWDSNPRWALTHSGFRDRCTNPLCDLSVIK